MKKIILLLLIILSLHSCTGGDKKDDPKLRLKYINSKFRFSLQFPEKWISYMDFEKKEIIDPQIIIPVIYFALPTRSREWEPLNVPSGYADIFCVRIFTAAQWKLYKERYGKTDEFRISDKPAGNSSRFIYIIRYSNSIPVDLYIHMKESDSIADTFRIIKKD